MAKKKAKKKVATKRATKKVSLSSLLGPERKANADLYKEDPKRRELHLMHRAARNRLITPTGTGYKRALSTDLERDIKYHELARELINNGFDQVRAYAAVFGKSLKASATQADRVFNSAWMRELVLEMLQGSDGNVSDLPKEYLIDKLMQQIETNILDYMNGDGTWLTIEELKALPLPVQQQIEDIVIENVCIPVAVKDEEGQVITMNGEPVMRELRKQRVQIRVYNKQKAIELLAKIKQWINVKESKVQHTFLTVDVLVRAEARVKTLDRSAPIEGKAKRLTTD